MTSHLCLVTAENFENFDFFVLGWGAASRGNRVSTLRRNALPSFVNVNKFWTQGSVNPGIKPGHVDPWRQRQCIVSKPLDSIVPWHTIIYQNTGSLTHAALKPPKHALTLVDPQPDAQNSSLFTYNTFIKIPYMFRALPCSSSGGLRRNCNM
jgi:hypothetical protein